jgi:hypothetical protein
MYKQGVARPGRADFSENMIIYEPEKEGAGWLSLC